MPRYRKPRDAATLEVLDHFRRSIEAARLARGWSQRSLANMVGCAPSTISRVERGQLAPSTILFARIAIALGGVTIGARRVAR